MPAAKRGQRRAPAGQKSGGTKNTTRPRITVELEELSAANPTCCILIYGDNGVGKTALAGGSSSSNRAGKVAFCSTERGSISAKRTGSRAELWRAPDWPHVEAMLDWADENMGPDDWLIMDSVTKMDILLQRDILKGDHEMRGKDLDTMELQHWPLWQTKFLRFIDKMIDSNYNTILICSSMEGADRDGDIQVIPSITDTKRSNKAGYVRAQPDEVYYYGMTTDEDGEPIRRLLTQYYPPWFAKSRYDIFERSIDVEEGGFGIMGWIIDQLMEARDEAADK
jgi:hypothetical protein